MKNFFRSMSAFVRAIPHFILFELVYKLILLAAGVPLMALLLNLTMKAAGITYLDDESLLVYLHSPATIFVIIILLFVSGFFAFVELTALAACFSCYQKREKITVGEMLFTGLRGFRKAFRGTGIFRFALFTLCMPLVEFTVSSGVFLAPLMPLLKKLFASVSSYAAIALYLLIEALFILIIVGRSYSLHYLILTDKKFPECVKASREKINRKHLRMAGAFLLWMLFILTVTLLMTFGVSFLGIYIIRGFSKASFAYRKALVVIRYTFSVFAAVSAFFSAPAMMCWLTGRFFADNADEKITLPDRSRRKMEKSHRAVLITTVVVASVMTSAAFFRAVYKGNILLNSGLFTRTQISAHRGFSTAAPENTRYAFEAALESDTDYIELDVQLTKDGKLVVFHDNTLDRTTNGTGLLTEHTYDELMELSAGCKFGDGTEYADARIMTLEEVLRLVGKDKMLNIEIKDVGDAECAVEMTVDLITKYNITTSCYVSSFSYPLMRQVKRLEPKIKTALIANVATSTSFSRLKDIDAVSLNYLFVNKSVVNAAHRNGKRVFVWTVNSREDIEEMIVLGVDNIITNDPDTAAEAVYSDSTGDIVLKILEIICR
ncbi:MAG: glycerophosphoryl diester phosphodiesterase membrane domain-containing protein [Ruminococcus sp.]|nr:glycerophosphoryl diester phosphodiesterase membrane domain-containing protein [Ruminococcus sp.]